MCVQNGYHETKLFAFDGSVLIVKEEFSDTKEYTFNPMLFAKHDIEKFENASTRISTASKNSTKESFVSKIPLRIIAELLDVAQGVTSIIVGTIIAIHEEEGWWYTGHKGCKKKVIRSSDMVDLEADAPKKTSSGKSHGGALNAVSFQTSKRYEYNIKKMLPVFTVLRLFDDPEIIEFILPSTTLTKHDTEATSSAILSVTPLDLESQKDENTTPINTVKIIATTSGDNDPKKKRPAEDGIGSESSNGKKLLVEVKIEKDA
uniref:Uncharacterized protein n=1 Tax=Tanacetum cinerariifolium TaxID=118510 RepID=A0A6L2KQ18_TANCI|nr:hypothetical protein [Tanacetum cinerariifolium]